MRQKERGFTLNEAVISLAVVATLTAVSVPRVMRSLPNYRLARAGRALVVLMCRARLQAIQRSCIYYFDFDLDGDDNLESGGCILWEDRNSNLRKELLERCETALEFKALLDVHLGAYPSKLGGPQRGPKGTMVEAGDGDGVTFSQNRIKFNPNGTCSTGTIYLHNTKGRTLAIRLRYNGLTQLWRHDGHKWERW